MSPDREADGAGAPGVAQLAQEAGVLPAEPTGHRRREATRKKVADLCHQQVPTCTGRSETQLVPGLAAPASTWLAHGSRWRPPVV